MTRPEIIHSPDEMQQTSDRLRAEGLKVGFVPTMGALHQGHIALVRHARKLCDRLVVSIFVNPLQFDRKDDLDKYPRTLDSDVAMLEAEGVDLVYAPNAAAMYPDGFSTNISMGPLGDIFEGHFRPGFFDGVATVVAKLFGAVRPHMAVFGEKDYQQFRVVTKLSRELNLGVEVIGHPLVREQDGLALSSRNVHLNPEERAQSLCLFNALSKAAAMAKSGETSAEAIKAETVKIIEAAPLGRLEYVEIVEPENLETLKHLDRKARMIMAVWFGSTRLIDNMALNY